MDARVSADAARETARVPGAAAPAGRYAVWRFNWLVNHKLLAALERVRDHARGELLDVGCGTKRFAPVFAGRVRRYWGTDLGASRWGQAHPDAFADAPAQPFRPASFDTVLSLSLLTYLAEPQRMLDEAQRVLKPGGALIVEFTQMRPVDDAPRDYFRFTRHGAELLLRRAGFEPLEFVPVGGLWARVGLTMIAGLNRINRGPTRVVTELPVRVLYVVLQLWFALLDRLFFDPREVLAHVIVARKRG